MPERVLKTVVGGACAYEVYALVSGRVPTLSKLCRRHRAFEAFLLGTLVIHFHRQEKELCA